MKSRISDKGQVTVPKPLRDRLGLDPGQVLEFEERGGALVARKVADRDPVDAVYGMLKSNRSSDALVAELRGKPDAV